MKLIGTLDLMQMNQQDGATTAGAGAKKENVPLNLALLPFQKSDGKDA